MVNWDKWVNGFEIICMVLEMIWVEYDPVIFVLNEVLNYFWPPTSLWDPIEGMEWLDQLIREYGERRPLPNPEKHRKRVIRYMVFRQSFPEFELAFWEGLVSEVEGNSSRSLECTFENQISCLWFDITTWWLRNSIPTYCDIDYHESSRVVFIFCRILILWIKLILCSLLTIWARGVGPRTRPDQLSDWTWKDILIFLFSCLLFISVFCILG